MSELEQCCDRLMAAVCNQNKLLAALVRAIRECPLSNTSLMEQYSGTYYAAEYCVGAFTTPHQITVVDRNRLFMIISGHEAIRTAYCISLRDIAGQCSLEYPKTPVHLSLKDNGPMVWGQWYSDASQGTDVLVVNKDQSPKQESFMVNFRNFGM